MDTFYRHPFTDWVNFSQTVVSNIPLVQSFPARVPQNIVWDSARKGVINKKSIAKNSRHLCKYREFFCKETGNTGVLSMLYTLPLGFVQANLHFRLYSCMYCTCTVSFSIGRSSSRYKNIWGVAPWKQKVWKTPHSRIIRNRRRLSVCSFKFFRQVIHTYDKKETTNTTQNCMCWYSVSMQYMWVDGAMYLRFRHIWMCGRTHTLNPRRVSLSNNAEVVSHI
jgi:hypothetical protein